MNPNMNPTEKTSPNTVELCSSSINTYPLTDQQFPVRPLQAFQHDRPFHLDRPFFR